MDSENDGDTASPDTSLFTGISFTDNGIGMSADDLHGYLSRIGASGTKRLGRGNEQVLINVLQ